VATENKSFSLIMENNLFHYLLFFVHIILFCTVIHKIYAEYFTGLGKVERKENK
jgi:hypothetical protein